MRKLRAATPGRTALASLATLAAALLLPLPDAAAQTVAERTIASDLCNYASNKPGQLSAQLEDLLDDAGFIGLPENDCPKFVKSLVKSCIALVKAGTKCTVDVNAAVGFNAGTMSDIACDTQPTKDDVKSCKSTVKTNTKSNKAVASQPVQISGVNACNQAFAADMLELCLEGTIEP